MKPFRSLVNIMMVCIAPPIGAVILANAYANTETTKELKKTLRDMINGETFLWG